MLRSFRFVAIIGAAVAALFPPLHQSHAWGPEAHRAIALIADKVLQQNDAAVRLRPPGMALVQWRKQRGKGRADHGNKAKRPPHPIPLNIGPLVLSSGLDRKSVV